MTDYANMTPRERREAERKARRSHRHDWETFTTSDTTHRCTTCGSWGKEDRNGAIRKVGA